MSLYLVFKQNPLNLVFCQKIKNKENKDLLLNIDKSVKYWTGCCKIITCALVFQEFSYTYTLIYKPIKNLLFLLNFRRCWFIFGYDNCVTCQKGKLYDLYFKQFLVSKSSIYSRRTSCIIIYVDSTVLKLWYNKCYS